MPRLIVTSRYLKCGSKKKLKNYVKYIATREGVVRFFNERENYVGYIANRPNSHGLFSQTDVPINLNKIANEISEHKGNVWTHVVSLRRDDAQKMGYDNLKAWRDLVIRQIPNIAKNQKIDLKNLRWYAAFHDKKTNPHVHIIVYKGASGSISSGKNISSTSSATASSLPSRYTLWYEADISAGGESQSPAVQGIELEERLSK